MRVLALVRPSATHLSRFVPQRRMRARGGACAPHELHREEGRPRVVRGAHASACGSGLPCAGRAHTRTHTRAGVRVCSCVFANAERGEIRVHPPRTVDREADLKTFTFDSTYGPEYEPRVGAGRCPSEAALTVAGLRHTASQVHTAADLRHHRVPHCRERHEWLQRHHLCVRADGCGQELHDGRRANGRGLAGASRPARRCPGKRTTGDSRAVSHPRPLPHPQGIIPNSFQHIFDAIGLEADKKKQFLVRASYLEIYNEEIRDLLSKNPKSKHDLREDADRGVFVPGLTSLVVKTMEEIDDIRKVRRGAELGCRLRHQCSRREAVPRAPFRTCRRRASVTAVWGPPR